jgi:hypothetical protein
MDPAGRLGSGIIPRRRRCSNLPAGRIETRRKTATGPAWPEIQLGIPRLEFQAGQLADSPVIIEKGLGSGLDQGYHAAHIASTHTPMM